MPTHNLKQSSTAKNLLQKHPKLIHSDSKKVNSHTQRQDEEWIINTVMIEGCDAPFRFKRKKAYQNLKGAQVNITYYPIIEKMAGMEFEVMSVVRIRKA